MNNARLDNAECRATDSCGSDLAPLYFIAFMVVGALVMVNLFIAVILENFSNSGDDDIDDVTMDKIQKWADSWSKYDPLASKKLIAHKFEDMMSEAPFPFGFGKKLSRSRVLRRLQKTNIPIFKVRNKESFRGRDWMAEFLPTLKTMAQIAAGVDTEVEETDAVVGGWECEKKVLACLRGSDEDDINTSTIDQWFAVQTIEINYLMSKGLKKRATELYTSEGVLSSRPDSSEHIAEEPQNVPNASRGSEEPASDLEEVELKED